MQKIKNKMKPEMPMQTKSHNPLICKKILNYLNLKVDTKDSLDGILLGLFPNEIEKISEEILRNLKFLISIGKIQTYKDGENRGVYRISKNDCTSI